MLADFYIPRLLNDMKIAVQKNNLEGKIWFRSLDPVKKNGVLAVFPISTARHADDKNWISLGTLCPPYCMG